jgi:hypothetical protein
VLAVLVLGALGAGAWWFFLREGAPIQIGEPDHPVPDFTFEVSKVNGTAPGGEVTSSDVEDAADGIHETLDAMYVAGFVDPGKREGGAYPELLEQFSDAASERASAELQQFTLGTGAEQVAFVEPVLGVLKVRVMFDGESDPVGAVASTRFVADGELDRGGPMFVVHRGTYYLEPDGGRWLVSGYDVNGLVQVGPRLIGPGASPQPGPTS